MQKQSHEIQTNPSTQNAQINKERLSKILAIMARVPAQDDVSAHDQTLIASSSKLYQQAFE